MSSSNKTQAMLKTIAAITAMSENEQSQIRETTQEKVPSFTESILADPGAVCRVAGIFVGESLL